MSVIAWDGRSIAADRQATSGDFCYEAEKLYQRPLEKKVLGVVGPEAEGLALMKWYTDGADPEKWPKTQQVENPPWLIVAGESGVSIIVSAPIEIPVREPFMAWGVGREVAMGAMSAGGTAKMAVEAACRWNIYCGLGIDVFDLYNLQGGNK